MDAFPKDVRLLTRLGDALWCARRSAGSARADGSRFSRLFRFAVADATPRSCLGQPGDALRVLELALTSRRAGVRGADGAGAAGATAATPPLDSEHDIMAATARALYAHGAKDAAATLVMRILRESDEKHPAALLEYGAPPNLFALRLAT